MKPTTLTWCAAIVAACASIPTPTAAETARLDAARELLASDPHRALALTDELLRDNPHLRQARLLAGEGSLLLARDGSSGRADLLLQDAVHNFELGLADRPRGDEPRAFVQLAECHFELGDFEHASAAALRAVEGFRAINTGQSHRDAAGALLLAARADFRRFVAARQVEIETGDKDRRGIVPPGSETAQLANVSATRFDAVRREFPAVAVVQIAAIHQWLGNGAGTLKELERGLRDAPDTTEIHDAYLKWFLDNDQHVALVGAYARLVREQPAVPILRWHQGRALSAHADRLRRDGNHQAAAAAYQKAHAAFGEYGAMVPAHADATGQWLALCELATADCVLALGSADRAAEHLFAAADASPLTTSFDNGRPQLADAFGQDFARIAFAIHVRLVEGGDDALARALAFDERVLQRCPDRFGFVYNNAALAARDLGVQRQKQGDEAAAMELWERSYGYYQKAVELSPDDARIVNDCGLMLIYHLHRDYDRARTMFDRAIELGTAQLEALPSNTDAGERDRLEEAVGDAWQNIAVLLREHQGAAFETYKPFCEQAVRYYPYQRREAAALLRDQGGVTLGSTTRGAASPAAATQGGAAEALAKVAAQVQAKADAEDYDAALALLDGISKQCTDHAPFQLLRGQMNLKLARQARDTGRSGVDFFYQDAMRALTRAVELDSEPAAPRQLLAEATYESGDTAAAAKITSALLLHLQSQGGGTNEQVLAAHTVRANAAARAFATAKAEKQDEPELLAAARTSFRLLEDKDQLTPELRTLWSVTEQWAAAPAEAVNVYLRALRKTPDDQALLGAAVDTAAAQRQLPLAVEALASRSDATGLWYLGRARYLLADAERNAGRADAAQQLLDEARAAFSASMQKNPDYRDSCEQWLAMCLGKKGVIAFHGDDDKNAEAWLLESMRLRPDRIHEDLGGGETTKRAVLYLVDRFMKRNDLARVEAISRAAADAANGDVDLLNNAGLFARDLGNALEQAGKQKAAAEMYEQSYKAYRRAQQLDPQNVRLRNDCALIAIYHLERDWEQSRELLDAAIADGEAKLREDPPADANEREQLDEAVGDCYENLALWHLKHGQDAAAAKAAALASMQHHPGQRRGGAQRHLQAAERLLRGK
jgi:tetratricopeptide (TPR) repeat protein